MQAYNLAINDLAKFTFEAWRSVNIIVEDFIENEVSKCLCTGVVWKIKGLQWFMENAKAQSYLP